MGKRKKSDDHTPRFDVYHATPASLGGSSRAGGTGTGTGGAAADDSLIICTCIENRAFEVGIAAIDLKSNSMSLTQLGDNQDFSSTLAMMESYDPVEIIVHDKSRGSKLRATLERHLVDGRGEIVTIERQLFNDTDGLQFLKDEDLCVLVNVTIKSLEPKYLAVAAAHALHRYCSYVQRVPNGLPLVKVSLKVHEDILLLDHGTVQTLELIENTKTGKQRIGSLFAVINKTKTAMGSRLMRSSLLQPLKNPDVINARLDAVDQLTTERDLYYALQQALEQFPDLERISSNLLVKSKAELEFSSIGPINPATIMLLLHLNTALSKIFAILPMLEEHSGESTLLRNILGALQVRCSGGRDQTVDMDDTPMYDDDTPAGSTPGWSDEASSIEPPSGADYSSVDSRYSSDGDTPGGSETALERLQKAISTKLSNGHHTKPKGGEQLRLQTVNVIAPGVDGYLDSAREVYSDLVDDIHAYKEQLVEEYGMERLQLRFRSSGYHFEYPADAGELPDISTRKELLKNKKWMFFTKELSALTDRVNESLTDIYQFTNAEVQGIFRVCREEVSGLYKAAEAVSMLDLLYSFATTRVQAGDKQYCRPKISDSSQQGTLAIKQGRHPILDEISASPIIPNDTFHNDSQNFALISGPNMAGKSTYIKQVALCVVLAHVGAYVPAEFFASPPIDRIFTRTSTQDDLANNESSFLTEMKEVAQITRGLSDSHATSGAGNTRALVIVDELGRGTSPADGLSIAWAVAETLMQKDAFVLFVTHFDQLNSMQNIYSNVRNSHLAATVAPGGGERSDSRLQYEFALKPGACTLTNYGLSAAEVSGLPQKTLTMAHKVADQLAAQQKAREEQREQRRADAAQDTAVVLELVRKLRALKGSSLATDSTALKAHLKSLQSEFTEMEAHEQ